MEDDLLEKDGQWQIGRHRVIIELCEGERCFAEFAVLLLRVSQPFHQTLLVYETYASAAFAWIEQRLVSCPFAATDSTVISFIFEQDFLAF